MNLLALRLVNQQLVHRKFTRPADVVASFGAIQAQDYPAAKWAVAQRVPAARDCDVEQAFADGAILRTHLMRPTWHFVSPADIHWLLALTAPRVNRLWAIHHRKLGLDAAFFARSHKAIARSLEGGHHRTRLEIGAVLQQAGVIKPGTPGGDQGLIHIMARAELDGVVCSGPRKGKQFTYALLTERAPHVTVLSRPEALAQLCLRYFNSHGPATLQDFAWWSGLTVTDAREALHLNRRYLLSEVADEQTYWMPPVSPVGDRLRPSAHLLPNFDEYIVAYVDRRAVFDESLASAIGARANILFNHTLVLDGRIVGTWTRSLEKTGATIRTNLFMPLSTAQANRIAAAAERYRAFLDLNPRQIKSSVSQKP